MLPLILTGHRAQDARFYRANVSCDLSGRDSRRPAPITRRAKGSTFAQCALGAANDSCLRSGGDVWDHRLSVIYEVWANQVKRDAVGGVSAARWRRGRRAAWAWRGGGLAADKERHETRRRISYRASLFVTSPTPPPHALAVYLPGHTCPLRGRRVRRTANERHYIIPIAMKLLKSKKKKRRYWVHPINRGRQDKGEFHRLVRELESDDEKFHQYFRMNQAQYEEIHSLIEGDIKSTYEIS
ncbi:hypothetical protein EVAR_2517_1 [Eumeta japonica]|uniref:Uncharacterized protein n=1 Tax=Eumeta variegata TaxID=151549 RepID=A0A4C1SPA5_EUMVA|nr:hypothetical protein EVAR_2517_1 [Eumeta japonica]